MQEINTNTMTLLTYIILFSLLGGLVSLSFAVLLLSKKSITKSFSLYATPFAAGALLAAVFLDLLPEAVTETSARSVLMTALIGILIFFLAERFLKWFHHHHQHGDSDPSIPLIITGDVMHNAIDGVAIAAAFMVSIPTGIVTTFAVASHEIPQEIGEFGLLLKKGMRRKSVLLVNVFSALATVFAAILTYIIGSAEQIPLGIILGLSAGFLLYIALSDIIPTLHESNSGKRLFDLQPVLLLLGVVVVGLAIHLAHDYIDVEGAHGHADETHIEHGHDEHDEEHKDERHPGE
jgi:zinc and cadmium transporter